MCQAWLYDNINSSSGISIGIIGSSSSIDISIVSISIDVLMFTSARILLVSSVRQQELP